MKITMSDNGRLEIDGKEFTGKNIQISKGKVIVDGVVQDGSLSGEINVQVYGKVERLDVSCGNVTADDVGSLQVGTGDVSCGDVYQSVQVGVGDIQCRNVSGSVKTGVGDINHG